MKNFQDKKNKRKENEIKKREEALEKEKGIIKMKKK